LVENANMFSLKFPRGQVFEPSRPARAVIRRLAAHALLAASAALARMSARLAASEIATCADQTLPELEYWAEAGAPEGALYVNGRLVGWIAGVSRL
jgi:hypothetical protein